LSILMRLLFPAMLVGAASTAIRDPAELPERRLSLALKTVAAAPSPGLRIAIIQPKSTVAFAVLALIARNGVEPLDRLICVQLSRGVPCAAALSVPADPNSRICPSRWLNEPGPAALYPFAEAL
jgi:hypothetical protein